MCCNVILRKGMPGRLAFTPALYKSSRCFVYFSARSEFEASRYSRQLIALVESNFDSKMDCDFESKIECNFDINDGPSH